MLVLGLIGTTLVLCWTVFCLLGGLPLLLKLNYDVPNDSRFVRGMFNVYYIGLAAAAVVASAGFAGAGRIPFAIGMGAIALATLVIRHWMLARMDALRPVVLAQDPGAIARFRRAHIDGLLLNTAKLCAVAWSITQIPT